MTPHPEDELLRRQRERARLMAWLLGAFVVLLFLITVAKIGIRENHGRGQPVEENDLARCDLELLQGARAVGFGGCKRLVDRFDCAESLDDSDGGFSAAAAVAAASAEKGGAH